MLTIPEGRTAEQNCADKEESHHVMRMSLFAGWGKANLGTKHL
jgi:hypothetical protein